MAAYLAGYFPISLKIALKGIALSLYQLAQLNIATMKDSLDSPLMRDFVANLDRINALAEAAPGFIWRLQDENGDATAIRPFGDDVLVNMSVWRDVESLHDYAFKSGHVDMMRRRREWFERMSEAYVVLWWVRHGHRPTIGEAADRLVRLRECGPSAYAFTFKDVFPAPDDPASALARQHGDSCPAG